MSPDDRIACIDANFDNYIKIFTKQFPEDIRDSNAQSEFTALHLLAYVLIVLQKTLLTNLKL